MRNVVTVFSSSAVAALLAGCGGAGMISAPPAVGEPQALKHHQTFRYTGKEQSFTVPSGVALISVVAVGAGGGGSAGGHGGRVFAELPVSAGEHLAVYVGGMAHGAEGGYNGGGRGISYSGSGLSYGGGGATDIRAGGNALHDRILVIGGGGGGGGWGYNEESGGGGGGGGGSSFHYSKVRKYQSWLGWITATGDGLVVISW